MSTVAFWGPLEDPRTIPELAGREPADRLLVADEDRLDAIAAAFARVIDAKSPYTARHSDGVARYAVAAAAQLGLDAAARRELYRAGLLHDIGKLAVSSRILDKPGKLDAGEWEQMRRHPLSRRCKRPRSARSASRRRRTRPRGD